MEHCAYLFGPPQTRAVFRRIAGDFIVDEVLNFTLDGTGEHCFVHVEKTGMNTTFVARHIASVCGVRERDVSYSGLKDRHAVARQWFSLHLAGKPDPPPGDLEIPGLRILHCQRHQRKLRRGAHTGNDFVITLRDVTGDQQQFESRLQAISDSGFPNYFGQQRFGLSGQNIERARRLFAITGKPRKRDNKQGIYLSAARSYLFNQVLSQRIEQGRYALINTGDVLMLEGSHSVFGVDHVDDTLHARLNNTDVHLTGPMWGSGTTITSAEQHRWEQACLAGNETLCQGLVAHKIKHARRALRALAKNLTWQWLDDSTLQISFHLGRGSYATSLLREVTTLSETNQSK